MSSGRLRVLLSAYACEPGKGSEPGTGWNMALTLARSFDVTVITRANNRGPIEDALEPLSGPKPAFIYHDLPPVARLLKKRGLLSTQAYYALWQRSLGRQIPKTYDLGAFDLFHHLTFNSFEISPGLLTSFQGIKVWGPLGGGQRAPKALAKTFPLMARLKEHLRSLRITFSQHNPRLLRHLESCDLVLFANNETRDLFNSRKLKSAMQMIDVGVDPAHFTPSGKATEGHRFFSAGNFEMRKGIRLLLLAFRQAHRENPKLRLRLAGDGPEFQRSREWVTQNSLDEVVTFCGRRSHSEMAEEFANADVFVFPSIRDTSGAIVLEAMACGLPVVCLDHQGGRLMVGENGGIKVSPQTIEITASRIADAMLKLSGDASLRRSLGQSARERVLSEFTWEKKATRLGGEYSRLCKR